MFKEYRLFLVLMFLSLFFVFSITLVRAAEISRDARKYMIRGQAAMEEAKDASDYQDAVKEFKKAVEYAPHWADAWFNLGVAQEKAEDYAGAINSFNKYLELNPTATDRNEIEGLIFKLEYKKEKEGRKKVERKLEKAKEHDYSSLAGEWCWEGNCKPPYITLKVQGNTFEAAWKGESWEQWNQVWKDTAIYKGKFLEGGRIEGEVTDGRFLVSGSKCSNTLFYDTYPMTGELKRGDFITSKGNVVQGGVIIIRFSSWGNHNFNYRNCTWERGEKTNEYSGWSNSVHVLRRAR